MFSSLTSVAACMVSASLLCASGCQRQEDGPQRFQCEGKITFQGKPIPKGSISFEPDFKAGNSGPGTMVRIQNGTYSTSPGKGIVGGAYRVVIFGYDGKSPDGLGDGQPLFPELTLTREFPFKNCREDFQLTAEDTAAKNLRK